MREAELYIKLSENRVRCDLCAHLCRLRPGHRRLPLETLKKARDIGLAAGLHYVFEGNRPGVGGENTNCHHCGEVLIERYGFKVVNNKIQDKCCPVCRTEVAGIF